LIKGKEGQGGTSRYLWASRPHTGAQDGDNLGKALADLLLVVIRPAAAKIKGQGTKEARKQNEVLQ
jgi:hypothetical protein